MTLRPCLTDDEIQVWLEQAQRVRLYFGKASTLDPCADCLVPFSEEMRAIGRCNGTPGVAEPEVRPEELRQRRRDSNRRAQQKWREKNQAAIREARRAYFAERWRKQVDARNAATGRVGWDAAAPSSPGSSGA